MDGTCYGRVHPCVEDISFGGEFSVSAFWASFVLRVLLFRVDGRPVFLGQRDFAAFLAVPYWDWGAEDSLPAYDPVPVEGFCPVYEAGFHVIGIPLESVGCLLHVFGELAGFHEPLLRLQDLDWGVAAIAQAHFLLNRLGLDKQSLLLEVGDYGFLSLKGCQAIISACFLVHPSILGQDRDGRELVFGYGFDVCLVAVGAYHDDACSVLGVDHVVLDYFDCTVCSGYADALAHVLRVAFIFGVDGYSDAGGY